AFLSPSKGIVAVTSDDHEISHQDVERVMQAASVVSLPPNREVLEVVSKQFVIDGYSGFKDPIGMVGMRLELDALLVIGNLTAVSNLRRSVTHAGFEIAGFVLKSLALGEYLLTADECELGVALLDIGASAVEMAYFEGGAIRNIGVVPLGGHSVTNDLAMGLRTSSIIAERIKMDYDFFSAQQEDKWIDLAVFGGQEPRRVSTKVIVDMIEPRYDEIFRLVRDEIARFKVGEILPAGIVVSGGVAKTKGIGVLLKRYFPSNSSRLGLNLHETVDDVGYNTVLSIINYAYALNSRTKDRNSGESQKKSGGIISRFKDFLKDFWE
ncbi:MAG: cell division protein FtsA, partial [bacterium]|nr:cell division protein FtsA [bacterium]